MKLTIIYHLYNDLTNLKVSLDSLFNQTNKDFEIIFVDDNMSNEVQQIFSEYDISSNKIKLISTTENYGRSFSYNSALNYAHGDYVYFTESRCTFFDEFVAKLLQICKSKKYDFISFLTQTNDQATVFNQELIEYEKDSLKVPSFIVNTKLSIKDKIFKRKFLIDNKIKFINFKNFYPLYLFDVLKNAHFGYFLNEQLILWNHTKMGSSYHYNLYDILESATILISKIDESNLDDVKKEAYKTWIPFLILHEFVSKMKKSYTSDKILSRALENANELINKLDFNYKENKSLDLLLDSQKKNYIQNFKPVFSFFRKRFRLS